MIPGLARKLIGWIGGLLKRLTLVQQFMLASLIILVASMLGIGWWVGRQIEIGVMNRTSGETALYVDSFIDPPLQELGQGADLAPEHIAALNKLVEQTPLGQHIVAFKVWDTHGKVVYSTNPELIGQVYPIKEELQRSIDGEVTSDINDLSDPENFFERSRWPRLLETYSPVQKIGSEEVIAVVEFYQTVDSLEKATFSAQTSSWLVVGGATLLVYLSLAGLVRKANDTIVRQREELSKQVVQLKEVLAQNKELQERMSRAAARATDLNERFLRRVSAELHDGPSQDLGLALMRLDRVIATSEGCNLLNAHSQNCHQELEDVQRSMRTAMQEIRGISGGLGLPQLGNMTLPQTLARVVYVHERRTGTKVATTFNAVPEKAPLSVKITVYRVIQEALSNSYRHAGGKGQQLQVNGSDDHLNIQVSDEGPGFHVVYQAEWDKHLGLGGMRERVESLGGEFRIESAPGNGTRVFARLSLSEKEGANNHVR